jgi:hypothetical protein
MNQNKEVMKMEFKLIKIKKINIAEIEKYLTINPKFVAVWEYNLDNIKNRLPDEIGIFNGERLIIDYSHLTTEEEIDDVREEIKQNNKGV